MRSILVPLGGGSNDTLLYRPEILTTPERFVAAVGALPLAASAQFESNRRLGQQDCGKNMEAITRTFTAPNLEMLRSRVNFHDLGNIFNGFWDRGTRLWTPRGPNRLGMASLE